MAGTDGNIKVDLAVVQELWDRLSELVEFLNVESVAINDKGDEVFGSLKGEYANKLMAYNRYVFSIANTYVADVEALRMKIHAAGKKIYDADLASSQRLG